ncbi:MAG: flagellar FliJ family protein [Candidatus Acidiferrum sp.]|jgi:flagellar export protein FliJ
MAFRYTLESLLRLRRSMERQEEQRLFVLATEVARLRTQIECLYQEDFESRRIELREMTSGSSGASLQYMAICAAASESTRKKLALQLEEAERKRLNQLRVYQAAHQKREILEGLLERKETAYELEAARQEQQLADEAFLMRALAVPSE